MYFPCVEYFGISGVDSEMTSQMETNIVPNQSKAVGKVAHFLDPNGCN